MEISITADDQNAPSNILFFLPMSVQKKIDCPQIVPAPLDPMPTGMSRDITITLANTIFSEVGEGMGRLRRANLVI